MGEFVESQAKESTLSPFISIWFRPRGTIRRIVDTDPRRYVLVLAALSGIYQTINAITATELGDVVPFVTVVLFSLVAGSLWGVLWLHMSGALFYWSGSWFGGTADSEKIRVALAWASVPQVVLLIVKILIITFSGHNWLTSYAIWAGDFEELYTIWEYFELVLNIWTAFLTIKCLAEVHKFSAWRSIASIGVVVVPIAIILFGCVVLTRGQ